MPDMTRDMDADPRNAAGDRDRAEERYRALFAAVYEPVQGYVARRARAGDVDDVVAETLTVLWRRLGDVPEGMELAYAYSVARRCLANHRRGEGRRLRLVDRLGRHRPMISSAPEPDAVATGDPALAAVLAGLPEDDRELLRLWAWEQLAPREIAVVLDTTANAVSVRLNRVRRRCAELLVDAVAMTGQDRPPDGHREGGNDKEVMR